MHWNLTRTHSKVVSPSTTLLFINFQRGSVRFCEWGYPLGGCHSLSLSRRVHFVNGCKNDCRLRWKKENNDCIPAYYRGGQKKRESQRERVAIKFDISDERRNRPNNNNHLLVYFFFSSFFFRRLPMISPSWNSLCKIPSLPATAYCLPFTPPSWCVSLLSCVLTDVRFRPRGPPLPLILGTDCQPFSLRCKLVSEYKTHSV